MNHAPLGIEADLGDHSADTFTQDFHPDLRADFFRDGGCMNNLGASGSDLNEESLAGWD